jgi:hypothetical protein
VCVCVCVLSRERDKWVAKAAVTRARIRRIKRTTAALVGTRTHPHPLTSSLTTARLVNDFLLAPPPIELRALRGERTTTAVSSKSCWIKVTQSLIGLCGVALMTSLSEAKDAAGSPTLGTSLTPGATRVMLLGSGELGKEVAIELMRLGVRWSSLLFPRSAHKPSVRGTQQSTEPHARPHPRTPART